MIIRVPVHYSATVRKARRRSTEVRTYTTHVDLMIAEVGLDAAPVALWYAQASWDPSIAVRKADGTFCEPLDGKRHHHDLPKQPGSARAFVKTRRDAIGSFALVPAAGLSMLLDPVDPPGHLGAVHPFEVHDDREVAQIVSSGRDAAIGTINAAAARLLLVDGVVHKRIAPPVIYAKGHYHRLEVGTASDRMEHGELAFPITALAQARKLGDRGDAESGAQVTIVAPELLAGFDFETWYLRKAAEVAVAHFARTASSSWRGWGESELSTYSRDVLLAYGQLRDDLAGGASDDQIAERLRRLDAVMDRYGVLRFLCETVRAAVDAYEALQAPAMGIS